MKIVRIYEYAKCSTCIKAIKFLTNARYALERIDIFTQPPTPEELRKMIAIQGDFRKVFNTAGHVYQEQGLAAKVKTMSVDEAVKLLAGSGRLVKRPFVLWEETGLVGFDPARWKEVFH